MVPGIAKELSYALEDPGDMGSRVYPNYAFHSYESAISFHPSTSSVQYLENYGPGPWTGEGWDSRAPDLPHVCLMQGETQQQEQEQACPYPLSQGPQYNGY